MNRKILFRGQTRRYGEKIMNFAGDKMPSNWVYGGIFPGHKDGDYSIIYTYDPIEKRCVYSDTVGQYTGLTDKNGTKIFEGDIISAHLDDLFPENEVRLKVVWHDYGWHGKNEDGYYDILDQTFVKQFEVIGNMHDNPELLERVADNSKGGTDNGK